ncbi:MAG: hypothetical protein ACLQQ4_15210 [Bacteroidia bacterium]
MRDKVKELQDIIHGHGKPIAPDAKAMSAPEVQQEEGTAMRTLQVIHEQRLLYKGSICNYNVLGNLPQDCSLMTVTLSVTEDTSDKRSRHKLDLYEREECKCCATEIAGIFYTNDALIMTELVQLTNLLEEYRDAQVATQQSKYKAGKPQSPMLPESEKEAIEFLAKPKLMERTDKVIEQAGIQDSQRLLLYIIGASYKSDVPLHIGISGNNNSVKSLINNIGQCLPLQDTLLLTQISARSFYHCNNGQLMHKVMLLPNGVTDKKVNQALGLLQQGDTLTTATSTKDALGNIVSAFNQVQSHFSSLMYVNPGQECTANMIVASLDAQTQSDKVMHYYNKKQAGLVDMQAELKAKEQLRNLVRCIKPMEVINPHAGKIILPVHEDVRADMNLLYQALVKQICLVHQYQRSRDDKGRLVAVPQDMRIAAEMLFSAMAMETDELEPPLRKFFDKVKAYVKKQAEDKEYRFTMREIRQHLKLSKNYCFRYMGELQELEYVKRIGYANKGYKYEVAYFDDVSKDRDKIKADLDLQFEKLNSGFDLPEHRTQEPQFRTPEAIESTENKGIHSGVLQNAKEYSYALNEHTPAYEKGKKSKNKGTNKQP